MAYTVLNESLQVKGKLTLNNGQGSTAFFADTITQQIATDNSSDPTNSTAMAFNEYDKQGNAKQWGHSITVSVEATDLGSGISTNDYLMYFDDVNNHYYLMKVITAETDRNSGFVTISGVNTAIYELGKQIINAETTFKQANLPTVVNSLYKNAPFSVVIQDDLATVIDYTVSTNTSLQAVLQDLQTKYDVDVDSWIELDESGNISDRIIYFGHIGKDNGELIRYGGAKGFENINAQELSDTIYTKLWVTGLTDDQNPAKGHIGSVNNGMEYILDDEANAKQYAIGASQQQPVYLEGSITNTLLSEPQALLTWAKAQMAIFNHPRFNYTVTPLHDQIVGVGDTIAVQDFHVKPEILVTSKVIQKTTSFSSPETNTFVLGEFSNIFTENANKGAGVIQLIKKDVTVVQEAADNARVAADEAHKQAVIAQEQAIHAQTSADGKTTTYTADSVQYLPQSANEGDIGWVKLFDGTHMYSYTDGKWVEKINPSMGADIDKKVSDVVIQAKDYSDKAIADNQVKIDESIKSVDDKANQLKQDQSGLDTKAQGYANQAKADAIANTTQAVKETLDNSQKALDQVKFDLTNGIAKEATDRQSAVNALDTKAQTYANQAKSDALNTIAKEVTDRQNAVTALDTKATNAVNQAKSDINDTINAISVGGRNYILNSKRTLSSQVTAMDTGWVDTSIPISALSNNVFTISVQVDYDNVTAVAGGNRIGAEVIAIRIQPDGSNVTKYFGVWHNTKVGESFHGRVFKTYDMRGVALKSVYTANHWGGGLYIDGVTGTNISVSNPKIEAGNLATDWTPAPEDVVLDYTTKDNEIKTTISQYQTTNDGKVSKVQTDVTTALGQVATKVSQTDYDTKTGDLSSKYTQVKQTVDSQATDIVDIKATATSQASKINTISSDVDGTKQSISDIKKTQDSQSDKVNQITNDVNGTKQSITDIQTKDDKQDTRMGTIETSVSGVKSDFSSYKTTNDGVVKTAQTTAQTAVDGLKNKVSQTDYNTKTGQLQTDLTTTTQTANQATTDIASIKQKDGDQDARMTQIESDASGVKTTVSDLQTAQGKQSGNISTLQQRADGFDATVTKVNNLAVGGRNLYLNSRGLTDSYATNGRVTVTVEHFDSTTNMWHFVASQGSGSNVCIYHYNYGTGKLPNSSDWSYSADIKGTGNPVQFGIERSDKNPIKGAIGSNWSRISQTGHVNDDVKTIIMYFDTTNSPLDVYIKLPKLETGNIPTDWTPAPEDVDSATAKAQLTADNAALAISNYKTNADGQISQAQADIKANATAITQKVSQTVYDQKTGDLTQAISKAQTTADGVVTTVGNYKTSNDKRVKAAESTIEQHSKDITARVTKTDYDKATGKISGDISTLQQRADGFDATVTKVNNLSVGGRNLFLGTKDFSGNGNWFIGGDLVKDVYQGLSAIQTTTAWGGPKYNNSALESQGVIQSVDDKFVMSAWVRNTGTSPIAIYFYGNWLSLQNYKVIDLPANSGWFRINSQPFGFTKTSGLTGSIRFEPTTASTGGNVQQVGLKLETGNIATDWTPAPEDIESALAQVKITADGVSSIVSNPTTGLSTRVQTAEGTLSKVQGTDIPALQNATFWQPYSSLNFNDYTKQGSFFFSTTASKTNGPTTSNGWLYLIVEQGTSAKDRIKQTAWYDGVTGVKITYVRTLNSGTWSPWYANDNDSVTTISQTNSDVRQEISDRKTGDSNTLQQGKNFTTSQISNSETGMKSFVNQTISGLQIGAIKDDVSSLKSQVNWQEMACDDVDYLKENGNYLITGGKGSNSPFAPWFYITVDAPRTDRITQTVWKDSNSNLTYKRSLFGTTWSAWSQVVSSATLLNIFHDSWSLGTTTNDGITKQMITGIMGQPDGTLILKGNSLILDGNTTVTGDFYAKGGNFTNLNASNIKVGTLDGYQVNIANVNVNNLVGDTITGFNFNVNKQMTIASGGIIQSDVIHMDKDSFTVKAPNINSHRISSEGYKVFTTDGVFNIDSVAGAFSSDGNISVAVDDNTDPYKKGVFHSEYGGNNLMMSATGYTNSDLDEFLNMSSARLDYMYSKTGLLSDASQHTSIRANLIETTGTLNAFGVTQTPRVYSWPNLTLESIQQSVVLRAGGKVLLQARENGSVYLPNRQSGSGGTSLQIAGDGGIFMQSSSTKYKTDIQYDGDTSVGDKFLTLDPATWQDKFEYEQREQYRKNGIEPSRQIYMNDRRYYGLIAEDLVKAGLEEFVVRDEVTGEVNGLEYDKVAISLIPVVREQRDAINELRLEVERLKQK